MILYKKLVHSAAVYSNVSSSLKPIAGTGCAAPVALFDSAQDLYLPVIFIFLLFSLSYIPATVAAAAAACASVRAGDYF